MKKAILIPAVLGLVCVNCITYMARSKYMVPKSLNGDKPRLSDCNCSYYLNWKKGLIIRQDDLEIHICSEGNEWRMLSMGPILPIIPCIWSCKGEYDKRWIRMGLTKCPVGSDSKADSISVTIERVIAEQEGGFYVSQSRRDKQQWIPRRINGQTEVTLQMAKGLDCWIGVPNGGEFEIWFRIAGQKRYKLKLRAKGSMEFGFVTV